MATPTINTYLSDMIALENHNLQPLKSQAADDELPKFPGAAKCINAAVSIVQKHIDALETRLSAVGGHAGVGAKTSVASAAGVVAAAINHVRKTEFSKDMRDDYVSMCLASASYSMLHTTALGLNDAETASLALAHLKDTSSLVLEFASALPSIVLQELEEEGASIDMSVAATAKANLEAAWTDAEAS